MNDGLAFGPDDEAAFHAAREDLLTRFQGSPHGPVDGDTFVAACMLDFQWGYMDGRLGHWTTDRVEDLLLAYFPRKVTLEPADLELVAGQVIAFLRFLHGARELSGDSPARLEAHVRRVDGDFRAAMRDESSGGMAKRIVRQMTIEGIDPTTPGAIDA